MKHILNVYTPKDICQMFHDIELAVALENFEPSETVDARYRYAMSLHPILSEAYICKKIPCMLGPDKYEYFKIKDLTYVSFMQLFRDVSGFIGYNTPLGEFDPFKWDGV